LGGEGFVQGMAELFQGSTGLFQGFTDLIQGFTGLILRFIGLILRCTGLFQGVFISIIPLCYQLMVKSSDNRGGVGQSPWHRKTVTLRPGDSPIR